MARSLRGAKAAVTGAASGIGRALALKLADEGCDLAISDLNGEGLRETRQLVGDRVKVTTSLLDVADRAAVFAWADQAAAEHGGINLIFNNAGVALGATIEKMKIEDFEWLMGINFWGVVYGTKAFLPHLKAADWGHIVNISSVFGIIGVPTQAAYNAAKFAVRGFTETLRQELEIDGCNVSATSVHPGGIRTNIARNSRIGELDGYGGTREEVADGFDQVAKTTPEKAAAVILAAVKGNRRRVLIGADAVLIDLMQRTMPEAYQLIVSGIARRARTTASPEPRPNDAEKV